MQLVVPSAVRNAVSAATITFTANSMIRCFFIFLSLINGFLISHRYSQKSQKFSFVLRTLLLSCSFFNCPAEIKEIKEIFRFALYAQPVPKALSVISVNFCVKKYFFYFLYLTFVFLCRDSA